MQSGDLAPMRRAATIGNRSSSLPHTPAARLLGSVDLPVDAVNWPVRRLRDLGAGEAFAPQAQQLLLSLAKLSQGLAKLAAGFRVRPGAGGGGRRTRFAGIGLVEPPSSIAPPHRRESPRERRSDPPARLSWLGEHR